MGQKVNTEKAKGVAQGGVSSNTQPAGQNRVSQNTKVSGVSKKGDMKKAAYESALEKAKAKFEEAVIKGDSELEETSFAEVEKFEKALEELEKAVGDRSESAPATEEDTVSKNGDEATAATENDAETGDTSGAVAKGDGESEGGEAEAGNEGEAEVEKNATVGTTNPDTASTQDMTGKVANVNESTGALQGTAFEAFQKHLDVSLQGVVSNVSNLIKGLEEKVNANASAIAKSDKKTDALSKMGGLSNSYGTDFEEDAEVVKQRNDLQKSEDEVFAGVTSLNGLSRDKK